MPHALPQHGQPQKTHQDRHPGTGPGTAAPRPAAEPPSDPAPPRRTRHPQARRDLGTAWLVLAGLLLLAAVPLVIELGRPALFHPTEARAHDTAIETTQRQEGFSDSDSSLEPWVPVYQGQRRFAQPPGAAWHHATALSWAERLTTPLSTPLVLRWAGVFMALVLVASVFWAGHNTGGLMPALFSAAVAMSMPLLLFFGRLAMPEMIAAAWSGLAMGSALWAIRPHRRNPRLPRQFLGWLICGLATGMATLVGGPGTALVTLAPIATMTLICPSRIGHALGLFAATAIAALLITPWAVYLHEVSPDGWAHWLDLLLLKSPDWTWSGYGTAVLWRLLAGAGLLGLWSVWLLPALLQPFSSSSKQARPQMLIGWAWLVTAGGLVILLPGPAAPAALIALVAPASLALGQTFGQFHDLCGEGRHAHFWGVGKWVMIVVIGLLSLALPAWGWLDHDLPDALRALRPEPNAWFAAMHLWYWIGLAAALALLAALGTRFAVTNHPGRAFGTWAAWTLVAAAVLAIPLARGPAFNTPAPPPTTPPAIAAP